MVDTSVWLRKELQLFDWSPSNFTFVDGSFYNVALSNVEFVGYHFDFAWYIGAMMIPANQKQYCCVAACGQEHLCDHQVTACNPRRIICKLPIHHCKIMHSIAGGEILIFQAKCCKKGERESFGNNMGVSGDFTQQWTQCVGEAPSRSQILEVLRAHDIFEAVPSVPIVKPLVACGNRVDSWFLTELFSGGFGGWRQAAMVMNMHDVPWRHSLGVEWDRIIAESYCKTFSCIQVDVEEVFASQRVCHPTGVADQSFVFRGNIEDLCWLNCVPWMQGIVAVMSPPCPPWGRSSPKDGLHCGAGRMFIVAIAAMRLLSPSSIAVENVDTIVKHPHFQTIMDTFAWAGYKLHWSGIDDLSAIAPTVRKRWLATFVPACTQVLMSCGLSLPVFPSLNMTSFRCFVELPSCHLDDLWLSPELLAVYRDPLFVTKGKGCSASMSEDDVLSKRVRGPFSRLSTVLASYGAQHEFCREFLKDFGLFAELFHDPKGGAQPIRFFSPFELALLMCPVAPLAFPLHSRVGHIVVGNCISVPQALLALTVARSCVDPGVGKSPIDMVVCGLVVRMHSDNCKVVLHDDGWLVLTSFESPHHHLLIEPDADLEVEMDNRSDEFIEANEHELQGIHDVSSSVLHVRQWSVVCSFPDATHVVVIPDGETARHAFESLSRLDLCNFVGFLGHGEVFGLDTPVHWDLHLHFQDFDEPSKALVVDRHSWILCRADTSPIEAIRACFPTVPKHCLDNLWIFDLTCTPVSSEACVSFNRLLILLPNIAGFTWSWKQILPGIDTCCKPFLTNLFLLWECLPSFHVCSEHIAVVRNMSNDVELSCKTWHSLSDLLLPIFRALGWYCQSDDVALPSVLCVGLLRPASTYSAPANACIQVLLHVVVVGILDAFMQKGGVLTKVKVAGIFCWKGPLSPTLTVGNLVQLVTFVAAQLGLGCFRPVFLGKRPDHDLSLRETLDLMRSTLHVSNGDDVKPVTFHFVGELRGGAGAKQDAWKEAKSMLGRELISHGWPLQGLDDVTSEWIQRLGTGRVLSFFKMHMHEKRWGAITDAAKWHGLSVQPSDPVKLRAVQAIQRAIRRKLPTTLRSSDFSIATGFFIFEDKSPAAVLQHIDMKASGVILLDFDQAQQWLSQTLPLVHDELAVLSLASAEIPQDVPKPEEIVFPGLDQKGRTVALRGHLWQLGQKKIGTSQVGHQVAPTETIVLAVTVWRDELETADDWDSFARSLVKSALNQLKLDTNSMVLQVWGRCYRDAQSRVDAQHALSAQFHMRVFLSDVEKFLQLSGIVGKGAIYITPKAESNLNHPDWCLIWLGPKMNCVVAADRATEHSGIVRAKGKWALRVKTNLAAAISKEIRPADPLTQPLPVRMMFKLEPIPVGLTFDQIVEWAAAFSWKIKIIKKLGKGAVLVGADRGPPHDFLAMNGKLVLVKQVLSEKRTDEQVVVAGPRHTALAALRAKSDASVSADSKDPWDQYRAKQGMSTGPCTPSQLANPGVGHGTGGAGSSRPIDAPIASKFSALEQRIATFEADIASLKDHHSDLAHKVQTNHDSVTSKMAEVDAKVTSLPQEFDNKIASAIMQAAKHQEAAMGARFEEIKALLSGHGAGSSVVTGKRPMQGKTDKEGDERMSPIKSDL